MCSTKEEWNSAEQIFERRNTESELHNKYVFVTSMTIPSNTKELYSVCWSRHLNAFFRFDVNKIVEKKRWK